MTSEEIEVTLERATKLVDFAAAEFEDGPACVQLVVVSMLAKEARDELDRIVTALAPIVAPTDPSDLPEDT